MLHRQAHAAVQLDGLFGSPDIDPACQRLQRARASQRKIAGSVLPEQHIGKADRGAHPIGQFHQRQSTLGRERRLRHFPAFPFRANPFRHRHAHIVQKYLGKFLVALNLADRANGNAGRPHVHQQISQPRLLRARYVGAHQQQAIRHRLAEAQVRINGTYWLAMKAAATCDPAASAMAALHAPETARICIYDFHQFLGAMGMTLEHPLHLWTYRLKLLIGELGGCAGQARSAADALWGAA